MDIIPVITPSGQFLNTSWIVTLHHVFNGGEVCTDRAEVVTTDGRHFVISLHSIHLDGLFGKPSANQSPASSGSVGSVGSVGVKSTDNAETELRARYDAADKECSILRERIKELERLNDEQYKRIGELKTHLGELVRVDHQREQSYKQNFDRATVQRDAAREELKYTLGECQSLRNSIDCHQRQLEKITTERDNAIAQTKHVAMDRDDHRRISDAYKARLDQIQGIVNP